MSEAPSYVMWDTKLNEIASDDKGLILFFSSSPTGELAWKEANEMTAELNNIKEI